MTCGPRPPRGASRHTARSRIADAAARLVVRRGCAAARAEAIAAEAGVRTEEVRRAFATRAAALTAALERAGAGAPAGVGAPWVRAALAAGSAAEQLRIQVAGTGRVLARAAPLLESVRLAAPEDTDAARVWRADLERRRRVQLELLSALAAKAPLRPDMTVRRAADVALALHGPETYTLLTRDRGWSVERWRSWAASALPRLVCRPPAAGRA
ncbi:TetR family transcriptional regulator [Nocardiopsis sp. CNT-189]|uniref:TetR family transcriptional regulator n=1 Tax=Nocardiopsis oceanisediminis TaxID=2816862 RepID=UPI003B38A3E2